MFEYFPEALKRGEALARTLPLRKLFSRTASVTGTQLTKADGSSTEYFDHRPYQPGDDPRFIDWNAYGRTEQYTIQLFQKETAPHIDIILDFSPSLFINEKKSMRTMELVYYLIVAAERVQAKMRFFLVSDDRPELIPREDLLQGTVWAHQPTANSVRMVDALSLKAGSNNAVISDVLFPGNPEGMCACLTRTPGTVVLFVPFLNSEACPDWRGPIEFDDFEGREQRKQLQCNQNFLARYRTAYAAHTHLWENAALRYGILLRRTCADEDLSHHLLLSTSYHGLGGSLL